MEKTPIEKKNRKKKVAIGDIVSLNDCIVGQYYIPIPLYYEILKKLEKAVLYRIQEERLFICTMDIDEFHNKFRFIFFDEKFIRVRKPRDITNPILLNVLSNDKK